MPVMGSRPAKWVLARMSCTPSALRGTWDQNTFSVRQICAFIIASCQIEPIPTSLGNHCHNPAAGRKGNVTEELLPSDVSVTQRLLLGSSLLSLRPWERHRRRRPFRGLGVGLYLKRGTNLKSPFMIRWCRHDLVKNTLSARVVQ